MKLSAPKQITWWISVILAIIAVVARWIPFLSFLTPAYLFIILLAGFVLLLLGTFVKGF